MLSRSLVGRPKKLVPLSIIAYFVLVTIKMSPIVAFYIFRVQYSVAVTGFHVTFSFLPNFAMS